VYCKTFFLRKNGVWGAGGWVFLAERRWIFHAGSGFWRDSSSELLLSRQSRKAAFAAIFFAVQEPLQGCLTWRFFVEEFIFVPA